jgi:hypothetical protein
VTTSYEVLQLLIWWGSLWPLGLAKEASYAASSSLPPPTLRLRHRLRPTTEIAIAPSGGRSFYSFTTLMACLLEEELSVVFILGWTPEDELRLQLWLSLIPGRTLSCTFRTSFVPALPMPAEVPASGVTLAIIIYNISGGGRLCHQGGAGGVAGWVLPCFRLC